MRVKEQYIKLHTLNQVKITLKCQRKRDMGKNVKQNKLIHCLIHKKMRISGFNLQLTNQTAKA